MFETLTGVRDTLHDVMAGFEPGCYSGPDAARLVEVFAEVKRLAAAGEALAARRVEDSNHWRRQGFRNAAQWMAAKTGATVGQALGTLETARRLGELPHTDEAFRAGRLSETQAKEITSAASAHPEVELHLLDKAATGTVAELRDTCRQVKQSGSEAEESYERIHRTRYLRHWTDHDGAVRLDARLTPDDGALVLAALDVRRQRIFAEARAAGRREPLEAYAADALVEMARGEGAAPGAMVHVRVDHDAFTRGHTEAGEVCDIPGIGPIPVSVARRLAGDAVLKVIVTDGVDVTAVAHGGRTIPAHLRSALEARDPVCVVPGCEVRHGLEIDHIVPFADGGPTSLDNCARLCHWHHYLKTHQGYVLGRDAGNWTWTGPERSPPDPP